MKSEMRQAKIIDINSPPYIPTMLAFKYPDITKRNKLKLIAAKRKMTQQELLVEIVDNFLKRENLNAKTPQ